MPEPDLSVSPRAIWKLTWPQMLMMYLVFFMGFINIWVAGRISADVQAALGMVNQCGLFLMVVAMSMSSGATAAVSQSLGAKRMRRAQLYVGTTVLGSLLAGILVALLGWQLGSPILRVLQVPERILPVTAGFWDITMLALPAQYVYAATGVMFRATRQVLPPLWVAATVCVFDLLGCLGLGLGWFGLPCMGYMGIAWANAGAQCLGAVANCLLLCRAGYLCRRAMPTTRWLRAGLPYLLKVALPAGSAGGILESVNVGIGGTFTSPKITLGMSVVAALLWPFRAELAALLSHEAGTQAQIINYLTYNLLSTPFSIASTVMGGVMVGAGATRYNLMVYGGTFWLVRLPLGWLLGHWLWGTASGVFLAMLVSQCLQTAIMFYVLLYRDWARFAMRARHHHDNR